MRPSGGGMRTHVMSLVERMDRDRFEVVVAAPEDAHIAACLEQCCGRYERVAIHGDPAPHRDVVAALMLARLIRRVRPDICHLHGFKASVLGRAAARFLERTSGLSRWARWGTAAPDCGPGGRPAIVYTVHNSVLSRTQSTLEGRLCGYLERCLAHVTDRVIAVSRALRDEYARIPGLGPDKVRHVPNGVALDCFIRGAWPPTPEKAAEARRVFACAPGKAVVGTVTRLIPDKGVGVLLHAVARLRRWGLRPEVLVAGDGPARGDLQMLAASLAISDQVRFLGFIEDITCFYRAIDVFVLPSLSEGMSLSLVEAMAAGVPVVASRIPGAEETVTPGTGWLAAPGDPLALTCCLRDALLRRHEAARMAEQALAEVQRKFAVEGMVRATQEVYDEALAERKRLSIRVRG